MVVQPGAADSQPPDVEQVESLRTSVAALKLAVQDVETFIARKHHKPAVCERANAPATWRSVCGWQYGRARFHRTFGLVDGANLCKRCFADSSVIASRHERGQRILLVIVRVLTSAFGAADSLVKSKLSPLSHAFISLSHVLYPLVWQELWHERIDLDRVGAEIQAFWLELTRPQSSLTAGH